MTDKERHERLSILVVILFILSSSLSSFADEMNIRYYDSQRMIRQEFGPPQAQTFSITATTEGSGTITPSGITTVNAGAGQTYTIAPNPGYYIADVLVDGVSVGAVTTYTFYNVTANHSIVAAFPFMPDPGESVTAIAGPVSVYIETPASVNAATSSLPVSVYVETPLTVNTTTPSLPVSAYIESPPAVNATTPSLPVSVKTEPCLSPVRIAGPTPVYYPTLQAAYETAADGATIQSQNHEFTENLNFNANKTLTFQGGFDCAFGSITGVTTIRAVNTTIGNGNLTIENFLIKD